MITSTGTATAKDTRQVTGAIAQQRHGFTTQGGENELADFTVGYGFQGLGVDNLDDVVVLPEVQTVLFSTFEAYARTAHLTHAEGVVGLDTQHLLDTLALFFRMGLSTDGQHLELGVASWVDTLLLHNLIQAGDVAGDSMDGRCSKVFDELDLTQGVTCSSRDGEHA